jgi:hypothetical protein
VSQVSKPYQIALVALVVLAAAWFTVLKPKNEAAAPPPPAPGMQGLGNAVDKAHGAVDASNASAQATTDAANAASDPTSAAAATPATGAKPAAAAPAVGSAAVKALAKSAAGDPSRPLLREMASGKVVVLLFWNPKGAEDVAARDAVRAMHRRNGRVAVHVADIKDVGNYEAITSGVEVMQSPTILVMNEDNKAQTITGYTDSRTLDQVVGDVGAKSFSRKTPKLDAFGKKVNAVCADLEFEQLATFNKPRTAADMKSDLSKAGVSVRRATTRVGALKAPASWKEFQSWFVRYGTVEAGLLKSAGSELAKGANPLAVAVELRKGAAGPEAEAQTRFKARGLTRCAA